MATSTIRNLPSIVEQGTSGMWTYRKWSDGVSECWGKVQWQTSYTQWGSVYYSTGSPQQNYPSGLFTEQPCEIVNLLGGGGDGWLGANTTAPASKDKTGSYYRMRPNNTSTTTATIAIHSIGKWK